MLRVLVDVNSSRRSLREDFRRGWSLSSERWTAQFHSTQSIWLSSLFSLSDSEVLRGIAQPLFLTTSAALAIFLFDIGTGNVPGRYASKSLLQVRLPDS